MNTHDLLELHRTESSLRALRKEASVLKPDYAKEGSPGKSKDPDKLTRKEWENLWRSRRSWKGKYRGYGGWRPNSGRKESGRTGHDINLYLPIGMCELLAKIPVGLKGRYVNEALEFYVTIKPPELMKPPPPRGRHADPTRKRAPKKRYRMNSLERARDNLNLVRSKLAALAAKKEQSQDGKL